MRPRIGVVGLNHGYVLARSVQACSDVLLAGLCTRNADRHRKEAEQLEAPLFDDIDAMLSALDLDGVVIAVPTNQLVSIAKSCLKRNVSVLIEKPLAVGVAEALELKSAAAASSSRIVIGYYRRLARQVSALTQLLAAGVIGEVTGVSCKWVIKKRPDYFKGWKASRKSGGGCLMINAVHDLDLLQQLFGPIATVSAMAYGRELADDVEHYVTVLMKFANGKIGTAVFSDQCPSPYSYDNTVAAETKFPQYSENSHHFFGTTGSLAFPSFTVHSNRSSGSSWVNTLIVSAASDSNRVTDDPIAREIEHFAAVLRGHQQPCATVDDAIQNLAVVEAIRRSLDSSSFQPVLARKMELD